ncbi:cytochrome c1, heme protein, mitochondrial-like [Corticium candelabrum]|uniref:cytochrome c1, heme protein, mitochondrial-like n=1 Tax=Corticium candelabrum TaxID=121492 RepID=UPI002E25BCB1|nr:cytochrome c1, heme protein, mitochondrial-like [Corticium candelabrum]
MSSRLLGLHRNLIRHRLPINAVIQTRLGSWKSAEVAGSRKLLYALLGVAGASGVVTLYGVATAQIDASGTEVEPPSYPWKHNGLLSALDHASIRRGFQVYTQVCAACHSMNQLSYRNLVGVTHTEEEAKQIAAEYMITDGPDDDGNMYERPGTLYDRFAKPYPNDAAARAANNGSLPRDLSWIVPASRGEEDYVFSLLTGYCDPPAGIKETEGLTYNPYFAGGMIGMPQALYPEAVEFEDGTPASIPQMAKDVATFLRWAAEPYHDERKRMGVKVMIVMTFLTAISFYLKRHRWTALKSRKLVYRPS